MIESPEKERRPVGKPDDAEQGNNSDLINRGYRLHRKPPVRGNHRPGGPRWRTNADRTAQQQESETERHLHPNRRKESDQ